MKTSEVVFELVLVPFQPSVPGQRMFSDKLSGASNEVGIDGQPYLIRTHVRVRKAEQLLWVVRAVNQKLWGLVGKRRFFLYHLESEQFYPLFKKDETDLGSVGKWSLNPELIRFFQDELVRLTKRKPKQLKLNLDVSQEEAERLASVMVAQRNTTPSTLTEAIEANHSVKEVVEFRQPSSGIAEESFFLSQAYKAGYDNRLK